VETSLFRTLLLPGQKWLRRSISAFPLMSCVLQIGVSLHRNAFYEAVTCSKSGLSSFPLYSRTEIRHPLPSTGTFSHPIATFACYKKGQSMMFHLILSPSP
jgi:hypothetical protein